MIYLNLTKKTIVTDPNQAQADTLSGDSVRCCWNWKKLEDVENEIKAIGAEGEWMAVDLGERCYPRFDIIKIPKVGDEVSYAFNGDYRPDGVITNISKSLRVITTSEGHKYYRKNLTGRWLYAKTFALIPGHKSELNPSF